MKPIGTAKVFERSAPEPECPDPMWGYAILRLEQVERHGMLYVPTAGVKGMETTPQAESPASVHNVRARVVKCSAQYLPLRSMHAVDTPFEPGDFVLTSKHPGQDGYIEQFPILLPKDHIALNICHIVAWRSNGRQAPKGGDA